MHLSIPENTEQRTYMHRNGFKSTICLYQQQEIHKWPWPHWDSDQYFNLQVSLHFLLDPVLQRIPFHFTYTGGPFHTYLPPLILCLSLPTCSHSLCCWLSFIYICLAVACHNSRGWPDPFRHAESRPSSCRCFTEMHQVPSLIWHASGLPNFWQRFR